MAAFFLWLPLFFASFAFPLGQGRWGDGIAAADHFEGQTSADLAPWSEDALIAWQDDRGVDPDLCVQRVSPSGERKLGETGRCLRRAGIQTNPVMVKDGVVFRESSEGADWSVVYGDFFSGDHVNEITLTEHAIGVSELQAVSTHDGPIVTWVASEEDQRSIQAAVVNDLGFEGVLICDHGGNVTDVRMIKNGELVFWTWTDWRDPLASQVYVQGLDFASLQLLFENNGRQLAPESASTWMARPMSSERGYVAIAFLERNDNAATELRFQIMDALGNFRFWPAPLVAGPSSLISSITTVATGESSFIAWNNGSELGSSMLDFYGNAVFEPWTQTLPVDRITQLSSAASPAFVWLAWQDDRYGRLFETVALQKFTLDHQTLWPDEGVEVSQNGHAKNRPLLLPFGEGACIAAWEDRTPDEGNPQLLLQRFE